MSAHDHATTDADFSDLPLLAAEIELMREQARSLRGKLGAATDGRSTLAGKARSLVAGEYQQMEIALFAARNHLAAAEAACARISTLADLYGNGGN